MVTILAAMVPIWHSLEYRSQKNLERLIDAGGVVAAESQLCLAVPLCSSMVFLSAKHLNSFKLVCVLIGTGFIVHFFKTKHQLFWHNCSLHCEPKQFSTKTGNSWQMSKMKCTHKRKVYSAAWSLTWKYGCQNLCVVKWCIVTQICARHYYQRKKTEDSNVSFLSYKKNLREEFTPKRLFQRFVLTIMQIVNE